VKATGQITLKVVPTPVLKWHYQKLGIKLFFKDTTGHAASYSLVFYRPTSSPVDQCICSHNASRWASGWYQQWFWHLYD
jgi:hypothetical protein